MNFLLIKLIIYIQSFFRLNRCDRRYKFGRILLVDIYFDEENIFFFYKFRNIQNIKV